jgi:hypothetical protein
MPATPKPGKRNISANSNPMPDRTRRMVRRIYIIGSNLVLGCKFTTKKSYMQEFKKNYL